MHQQNPGADDRVILQRLLGAKDVNDLDIDVRNRAQQNRLADLAANPAERFLDRSTFVIRRRYPTAEL